MSCLMELKWKQEAWWLMSPTQWVEWSTTGVLTQLLSGLSGGFKTAFSRMSLLSLSSSLPSRSKTSNVFVAFFYHLDVTLSHPGPWPFLPEWLYCQKKNVFVSYNMGFRFHVLQAGPGICFSLYLSISRRNESEFSPGFAYSFHTYRHREVQDLWKETCNCAPANSGKYQLRGCILSIGIFLLNTNMKEDNGGLWLRVLL